MLENSKSTYYLTWKRKEELTAFFTLYFTDLPTRGEERHYKEKATKNGN